MLDGSDICEIVWFALFLGIEPRDAFRFFRVARDAHPGTWDF